MPITISTPFPDIAFSRNELIFGVNSDNYQAAAPATTVNAVDFTGAIVENDTISLAWDTASALLTAKDVPDDSGLQFPTGAGDDDYVTSLLDWFRGNYFIGRDFTVAAVLGGAHPRLTFTALVQGPEYDFDPSAVGHTVVSNITPGVTAKPVTNFTHHIELLIADAAGATYQEAYNANVPLDEPRTGTTTIDASDELHVFLTPDRPVLASAYERCLNSIRSYYARYAQVFGVNPAVQRVRQTATAVITRGGLGKQAALSRDIISELCPDLAHPEQNLFLRLGSKNKLVLPAQPEWLTFLNLTAGALTVSLEVIVYNEDETTLTFTTAEALELPARSKWQFKCGFTQLDITGKQAADKRPLYYQVRVKKDDDTYLTAAYNFVLEYYYREFPRFFVYENSYGGFQTITATGKADPGFDRSKDDAQLSVSKTTAAISGEFIEANLKLRDKTTVNIGYRRTWKRDTALLRDLARSESVFVYENGLLLPVGIDTNSFKDGQDGLNVYASTFDYYPLYQEDVYSESPGLADETLQDLLSDAGSPVPSSVPDIPAAGNYLVVESTSPRLSIVDDHQQYTNAYYLAGKTGYRVYATQLNVYLRSEDISYDADAGSFIILIDAFTLQPGDQLIIWPAIQQLDE